jgi:molecular chaperone DnaK (HSP70)
MPEKRVFPMISQQLDQMLETIFEKYQKQNLTIMPLKQAIGIDLGTTYSCVGVMNRGKVHIILHEEERSTIPSYVTLNEEGEISMVGLYAKEESYAYPTNTIYEAKRMIGRKYSEKNIQNDMKLWSFEVVEVNDSLKIQIYTNREEEQTKTLYPEEVSAEILKKLKKNAEDFLGYEVKNAVITVPAYFNDAQRQATKHAGLLAGLNVMQILNEPTAAAIAYTHQIKDDVRKNILIYDLGGGTFDVAVVVIDKGNIDVRAVGGDTHLGGVDFDQRIMNYIYRKYEENFRKCSNKKELKIAKARLKIQCEQKKWILSVASSATIIVSQLLPGWDFKEVLKQSDFENLCMDLFKKTINIVDETLKSAKISKSDIDEIVLIGGSVKIPKIQNLLKEYFNGKALNKEIKTDEAVAYGATIQASLLNGEKFIDSNLALIHDVSPFSLGIEIKDKTMAVIIPRNSKLPVVKSQKCFTAEDNQTFVLIQVFEGENKIAKQNRLLGEFVIEGLPKRAAGMVTVDVTMEIDEEGILHVKGETTDKSANITIKDHRGRISPEQLKSLIKQD